MLLFRCSVEDVKDYFFFARGFAAGFAAEADFVVFLVRFAAFAGAAGVFF